MQKLVWFLAGSIALLLAAGLAAFIFLKTGAYGFSTRAAPSSIETFAAAEARRMALPAGARVRLNPVADSPEVIAEGRAHWADHCAACHSNNGSGEIDMGRHLYPPAPDMRKPSTQNLTDGELFYIIQNGVRLTGMPAWGNGTTRDEQDSWKLVRFIRHLPHLTPDEEREMQAMNPKSPDDLKEEQQEADFLNGGNSDEHKQTENRQNEARSHENTHRTH